MTQHNGEADIHDPPHGHAQGADAPLVGLVVHHDHGAAQTLLEIVNVCLVADLVRDQQLDVARKSLELRQGQVHEGPA